MKKRLGILVLVFLMVALTACGGSNGAEKAPEPASAIEKDVTMLLKGIGDSMDMVTSLGDLPEAQVNGNLYYYQNAGTEGYFSGFDLGIETDADGQTVKQIYIQPLGDAKISANGLIVGGTIADAKAALGEGELSSMEQNGKIVNFMSFTDETYAMKATVQDQAIVAAAFTLIDSESAESQTDGKESQTTEKQEAEDQESPAQPEETTAKTADELDYLLDFIGGKFDAVEQALGSGYTRFADEYEDVVTFEQGELNYVFSVDPDTETVNMVTVQHASFESKLENRVGMAGIWIGDSHAGDDYEFAYKGYSIYVMMDVNDRIFGLQACADISGESGETDQTSEAGQTVGDNEMVVDHVVFGVGAYDLILEDFDTYSVMSVRFDGTGEKVELVNTDGRWDGDQFFDGFDVKILKAKASKDGGAVYFETDDPKMTNGYGAANNTILKFDMNAGYEENLCLGFLYDTVKVAGYEDCIIIKHYQPNPRGDYYEPFVLIDGQSNYHFMGTELEADLASQVRRAYNDEIDEYAMDAPVAEKINGKYVDFSKYSVVVAENYQGINKDKFVRKTTLKNPYYKDDGQPLYPDTFAVFGTIYNVRWEVGINMGESKIYPVADEMSDTLVTYETRRPGDMSVDTFLFEDAKGREYRIVIEDMSDNIDLVTIP